MSSLDEQSNREYHSGDPHRSYHCEDCGVALADEERHRPAGQVVCQSCCPVCPARRGPQR